MIISIIVFLFIFIATIFATNNILEMPDNQNLQDLQEYKPAILKDANGDVKKRWYVEFYALDATTQKLKRKRVFISTKYKTKKDRYAFGNKLVKQINTLLMKGAHFNASKERKPDAAWEHQNVVELLEYAYQILTKNARYYSIKTYKSNKNNFINFLEENGLDNQKPENIPIQSYFQFFDEIVTKRNLSNSTYNTRLRTLKTLFNVLVRRKILEANPLAEIEKRKHTPKTNQAFTDEQREALETYLKEKAPNLYYFTRLIYSGFLRPTEITRLKAKHVKLQFNQIVVHAEMSKTAKPGVVIINKGLKNVFEEMKIDKIPENHYLFSTGLKPGTKRIFASNVSNIHGTILKDLGLFGKNLTLYSWKHTGVVNAYRAGVDIKTLQSLLRHHSLEMTDIYLRSLGLFHNKNIEEISW
ncbi:tyrosine-type recombinase/integrase [Rapidithrix thailandica]|uniref:Tyrosine-type recombinase/integrase n=1 Tax=Rapidithrix thailandica TaxID=413964 RepID=A0AAW9S1H2_9BACT